MEGVREEEGEGGVLSLLLLGAGMVARSMPVTTEVTAVVFFNFLYGSAQ